MKSIEIEFTEDELREIEEVIPMNEVAGTRYEQIEMKLVNN